MGLFHLNLPASRQIDLTSLHKSIATSHHKVKILSSHFKIRHSSFTDFTAYYININII